MRFSAAGIEGAWVVDVEPISDERGFFARTFDRSDFERRGLATSFETCSLSQNRRAGTLRGMHFQKAPFEEAKLVRCARGRLFDVIVDLRRDSPTFLQWRGFELDSGSLRSLYVPSGCAHGFLTLEEDTMVHYSIDAPYMAEAVGGMRWDDPAIDIDWPMPPKVMSMRDRSYPDMDVRLSGDLLRED